jgi:hypothetical protein
LIYLKSSLAYTASRDGFRVGWEWPWSPQITRKKIKAEKKEIFEVKN